MAKVLAFLDDYKHRREDHYAKRAAIRRANNAARTTPRNCNASTITLDCTRQMYHRIVDWDAMPDFSADAQERMDNGNVAAKAAAREVEEMGYDVVETESPMQAFRRASDGKVIITGRLDFKIDFEGVKIPVEVKDMNQNVFNSCQSFEDLARFWWTKKYQSQLLIYLLQNNQPEGLMLLLCQGRKKFLPVVLEEHLDLAERSLAACEAVMDHVEVQEPPAYTPDPTVCRRCPFWGRACNPPVEEQGAALLESGGELEQMLHLEKATAAAATANAAAKKRSRELLSHAMEIKDGIGLAVCGDFAISAKEVTPRGKKPYLRYTIAKSGDVKEEEGVA